MGKDGDKNVLNKKESAEQVSREALTDLNPQDPARCIDDRSISEELDYEALPEFVIKPDQYKGPQMLGGAYSPFDIALELAPESYSLDELEFDRLFNLTKSAFKKAGCVMGIHTGTLHGELSYEDIKELLEAAVAGEEVEIPDCGYNGMVNSDENPLGLSQRSVEFHKKYSGRAAKFAQKGVSVAVLGGHHAKKEEALAVINTKVGKTLDTKKAGDLGQQTYNHDKTPFEEILSALADAAGEIDIEWGNNIRGRGNEVYMKWLEVATNRLAGMDPAEV